MDFYTDNLHYRTENRYRASWPRPVQSHRYLGSIVDMTPYFYMPEKAKLNNKADWAAFDYSFHQYAASLSLMSRIIPSDNRRPFLPPPALPDPKPTIIDFLDTRGRLGYGRLIEDYDSHEWARFECELRDYRREQTAIAQLLDWLWEAVEDRYVVTACKDYTDVAKVYDRLRAIFTGDEAVRDVREQILDEYITAHPDSHPAPPPSTPHPAANLEEADRAIHVPEECEACIAGKRELVD